MFEPLARPPLVEAICEFRFEPSEQWDLTVPGRLYDLIRDDFPHREQVQGFGFSLQVGQGAGAPVPTVQGGLDRVLMAREDGSVLVQTGPHLLVVNHKLPYPGWEDFRALISRVLETYLDLVPSSFERVGLRYINQIPLPVAEGLEIGSLITLDPPIPPEMERPLANFYQRYELRHDDPIGILIHQTGMQLTQENDTVLMLDLDFGSLPEALPGTEDADAWLPSAHDRIEEAFRASVNPEFLDRMKRGD
ncbi:MAG: TIGR04255 family protein [Rubrobacter sp.]